MLHPASSWVDATRTLGETLTKFEYWAFVTSTSALTTPETSLEKTAVAVTVLRVVTDPAPSPSLKVNRILGSYVKEIGTAAAFGG